MKKQAETQPLPEGFGEFLHGLILESVEIESCSATIRDPEVRDVKGKNGPKRLLAFAHDAALIEAKPDHCIVSAFYGVRILPSKDATSEEQWMAELDVEYRLRYATESLMTEEFFEQFRAVTLRLNTVPFAREWIHSTSVKMGLRPVILPLAVSVDRPTPKLRRVRKEKL